MRILERAAALLVLSAWLVVPRAGAQSVVVGPLPAATTAFPGSSLTLPVAADLTSSGGASLGSIAARLTWRPGTLAFVSAGPGTLGAPTVNADSAASGILKFAIANASGATGMPVLLTLTFNVTGAPADTTVLGLTVSEITAAGTFADLKPITTTTGARFCTSTGLFGDLDGNSTIDAHDALIIVTNAVGLPIAPYSVANGDVDGNGVVDTRDALIVLSQAVGINVSQFRIGRVNPGVCSLRSAASVQIQPRTPSVAPGDSLPVTATVRDSTGALVQGIGLVWASKDATIARVGAAGNIVAIAPGSTYATVFVQPGVKDSVPVTVTSARHVWYVNPVVAAGNAGVELGSQLYPFSTIDTAVVRAAAGDTVRVATADYGPLKIGKPLVLLGDSSATGFPRLTNASGLAMFLDSIPGPVEIRGFRLLNSAGGLAALWVQTLTLGQVSVEGAQGKGIGVHAADSVNFSRTAVVGAVSAGIKLDSIRIAVLARVRSDAITRAQNDSGWPLALAVKHVGTLIGDSIGLGTAGANLDSLGAVTLRWIGVGGSQGPALFVRATSVSVVHGDFRGAGANGMPFSGDPNSYAVSLQAGSGAVRLDSSKVHDNGLFGLYVAGGSAASLRADTVANNFSGTSSDRTSWFAGFGSLALAQTAFLNNGPGVAEIQGTGVEPVTADSVILDASDAYVHDVAAFRMHGGIVRDGAAPGLDIEYVPTVELDSVEATATGGTATFGGFAMPAVFVYWADTATVNGFNGHDNGGGALGVVYAGGLRVNGGTFLRNGLQIPSAPLAARPAGLASYVFYTRATILVSQVGDARLRGVSLQDSADFGIYVEAASASSTVVDSSALQGSSYLIEASGLDTTAHLTLYGNTFTAWRSWAANVGATSVSADSNQFAGCASGFGAVTVFQAPTAVTRNTLTGCGALVAVYGQYVAGGPAVRVLGNTVTRDTTSSLPAIDLENGLGFVQVAGNAISGGGGAGIYVNGWSYPIDSVRVDSNSAQQTRSNGIYVAGVGGWTHLRYNLVADNVLTGLQMSVPFTATHNTVARNSSSGVVDNTTGGSSFRLGNVTGNLPYGVQTFASSMQADSNWWGRSPGPKCAAGCDTTTTATGDSIAGNVVFSPVVDTGAVAGAPAIPAPPPAPIARMLSARAVATPAASKAAVTGPAAGPQARLLAPRPARPAGRPAGHHDPIWKAGGRP